MSYEGNEPPLHTETEKLILENGNTRNTWTAESNKLDIWLPQIGLVQRTVSLEKVTPFITDLIAWVLNVSNQTISLAIQYEPRERGCSPRIRKSIYDRYCEKKKKMIDDIMGLAMWVNKARSDTDLMYPDSNLRKALNRATGQSVYKTIVHGKDIHIEDHRNAELIVGVALFMVKLRACKRTLGKLIIEILLSFHWVSVGFPPLFIGCLLRCNAISYFFFSCEGCRWTNGKVWYGNSSRLFKRKKITGPSPVENTWLYLSLYFCSSVSFL